MLLKLMNLCEFMGASPRRLCGPQDTDTQPLVAMRQKEMTLSKIYSQFLRGSKLSLPTNNNTGNLPLHSAENTHASLAPLANGEHSVQAYSHNHYHRNGQNKTVHNMPSHFNTFQRGSAESSAPYASAPGHRVERRSEFQEASMDGDSSAEIRPQRTDTFEEESMDIEMDGTPRPRRSQYFMEDSMDDDLGRPPRTQKYQEFDIDDASSSSTSLHGTPIGAVKKPLDSLAVVASSCRQTELVKDQKRRGSTKDSKKAERSQPVRSPPKSVWTREQDKDILLTWKTQRGWPDGAARGLAKKKDNSFGGKTQQQVCARPAIV